MKLAIFTKAFMVFLTCLCFVQLAFTQDTLAHWGFNEGAGNIANENVTNTNFTVNSHWPVVEWVSGVKQTAMRTDGYSVWAEGTLPGDLPSTAITVYAWAAMEVYPVSDAALWAQFDNTTNSGAWVGIDKFGRLKIECTISGTLQSFVSASTLTHYAWNYLVVNIDAQSGNITGYINATKVLDVTFTAGSMSWPSSKTTFIGKLPKGEMNGLYPINTMNAIIDEVGLLRTPLDQSQITLLYQQDKPASGPDMKVPSSRFAEDFLRPAYHPIPASNWCNESHGLIYNNGRYHLFYQKNGNGSYLFQQNWGHLISTDLVKWDEVKPALWPAPGWDNYGEWSGHVINDQTNTPTIFYTGVDGVKAGIGKASPASADLTDWQKSLQNPVIPASPSGVPNKDFRDCYVFKEGVTWYMIVGSGLQTPKVGNVFIYKSADLNNWQYVGLMYQGNNAQYNSGIFWEMPVFWKFAGKYLLLVNKTPETNSPARSFYWTGDFTNETFTPDNTAAKNLDLINWLLSPSVNTDKDGIVTAIGIIPDLLPSSQQYKNGYANLFSLAREWDLQGSRLIQKPHPSLKKLRSDSITFTNVNVTTSGSGFLNGASGFQKEIRASISVDPQTQQAGLIVGKNANGTEYTKIYYDYYYGEITIDRTHSSTNPAAQGDFQSASFFPDDPSAPLDWHVYIDGSVIEVFINDQYAFASRIYPASANSNGIDLFATNAPATANVKIWNINPLSVLPVTWLSFILQKQNSGAVQLQWNVSDQANNDHFEIQRSSDGINFYAIGNQIPALNSGSTGTYRFTDSHPIPGSNYYRIKQVDKEGRVTFSIIKKEIIAKDSEAAKTRLVQNPVKDFAELIFNTDVSQTYISLWNIAPGKIMQIRKSNLVKNQKIYISLKNLPAGLYYLKVMMGNETETHKVIIR